ncbi:Uncharacterised protein [Mycobacterium tuberculosis]|nr:Uncharacterised protein [Mycobacterium tuberculosis]
MLGQSGIGIVETKHGILLRPQYGEAQKPNKAGAFSLRPLRKLPPPKSPLDPVRLPP